MNILTPIGSGSQHEIGFGTAVSQSADGSIVAISAPAYNAYTGAVWLFNQNVLMGNQLTGSGSSGQSNQGTSVSLSSDGYTLAIGGYGDGGYSGTGATWVFKRNTDNTWSQMGNKLVGTGSVDPSFMGPAQGTSVSLSSNGTILAVGGPNDGTYNGAVWLFTRDSNDIWSQYGNKIVGSLGSSSMSSQGTSVSLSGDGKILAVGGNSDGDNLGAAWIFDTSTGTEITKLVGTGNIGNSGQGKSISLSSDGKTLAVGGPGDDSQVGAVWMYRNNGSGWLQIGKLIGSHVPGIVYMGGSVSLSGNGTELVVGGPLNDNISGCTWLFTDTNSVFYETNKLVIPQVRAQAKAVSISSDGSLILIGCPSNNNGIGYVYNVAVSSMPTVAPTDSPTYPPTYPPIDSPTYPPTYPPTDSPTYPPTYPPTYSPTFAPTYSPTFAPTDSPTYMPTDSPNGVPVLIPATISTNAPSVIPIVQELSFSNKMAIGFSVGIPLFILFILALTKVCKIIYNRYKTI